MYDFTLTQSASTNMRGIAWCFNTAKLTHFVDILGMTATKISREAFT